MQDLDDFGAFMLDRQVEAIGVQNQPEQSNIKWKQSIKVLYNNIARWLNDYVQLKQISIHEEESNRAGHWGDTTNLVISIGNDKIIFEPENNLISTFLGKVNVIGKPGKIKTFLQYEWHQWKIYERDNERNSEGDSMPNLNKENQTKNLNEKTFESLIKGLI